MASSLTLLALLLAIGAVIAILLLSLYFSSKVDRANANAITALARANAAGGGGGGGATTLGALDNVAAAVDTATDRNILSYDSVTGDYISFPDDAAIYEFTAGLARTRTPFVPVTVTDAVVASSFSQAKASLTRTLYDMVTSASIESRVVDISDDFYTSFDEGAVYISYPPNADDTVYLPIAVTVTASFSFYVEGTTEDAIARFTLVSDLDDPVDETDRTLTAAELEGGTQITTHVPSFGDDVFRYNATVTKTFYYSNPAGDDSPQVRLYWGMADATGTADVANTPTLNVVDGTFRAAIVNSTPAP